MILSLPMLQRQLFKGENTIIAIRIQLHTTSIETLHPLTYIGYFDAFAEVEFSFDWQEMQFREDFANIGRQLSDNTSTTIGEKRCQCGHRRT